MTQKEEGGLNGNILLAVDDSPNSRRAVEYVAFLLGGRKGFRVTLLHVIPEPEEDYFPEEAQKERWLAQYRKRLKTILGEYHQMLIDRGFAAQDIDVRMPQVYCPSMGDCIIAERDHLGFGTIVVGRQGLSRKEEFLFGSVSSKIVKHARHCTVWVVE
jgi:nucleotide-binding universal stress UspA family protein